MDLADIPDDILAEILRWLDGESLYLCSQVNKRFHANLHQCREFEYRYRLEKQEMINTRSGERSYESRIDVLKHFTWMWWSDSCGPRSPSEVYYVEGGCIAYELVGGVFATTDGASLTIQWLPSLLAPSRQVIFPPHEIGFSIKDFALDPTQDLIAFVDNRPYVLPLGRDILIHLRTLSTHGPHPKAKEPTIKFRFPFNSTGYTVLNLTIQLADDLLSVFFFDSPLLPGLVLWDWKTATMILNAIPPTSYFPPGSISFELLSPRAFALLSNSHCGSIHIYNIEYPKNPVTPPVCVAKLLMPTLLPGIQLESLQSHTGPFLGKLRRDALFTTSPDARVYVIAARFLNTRRAHATFFLHGSAFMPYIQSKNPQPMVKIPWEEWSHRKCFFSPLQLSTNWLRYVQGTRVILPMQDGEVGIFDFNLVRDPVREGPPSNWDLFTQDMRSILPPRTRVLKVESSCTSWMIDEDYILGLDTSGNVEERIRCLEVYSMHHIPRTELQSSIMQ